MLSSQDSEICKETIGPLVSFKKLRYYRNWNRNPYDPGISKYLSSPSFCPVCLFPREEEWQYGLRVCKFCEEVYSSVHREQICEDCYEANATDILVSENGLTGALRSPLALPYGSWSSVARNEAYASSRRRDDVSVAKPNGTPCRDQSYSKAVTEAQAERFQRLLLDKRLGRT